jgi:hypothetical protein
VELLDVSSGKQICSSCPIYLNETSGVTFYQLPCYLTYSFGVCKGAILTKMFRTTYLTIIIIKELHVRTHILRQTCFTNCKVVRTAKFDSRNVCKMRVNRKLDSNLFEWEHPP